MTIYLIRGNFGGIGELIVPDAIGGGGHIYRGKVDYRPACTFEMASREVSFMNPAGYQTVAV